MVWSLSKDGDGLGRVPTPTSAGTPAARDGFVDQRDALRGPRSGSVPAPINATHLPGATASVDPGTPSVVVDPDSQVPPPLKDDFHPERGSVEKTQVLKGRRVDVLRAEVERRRRTHQREKRGRLILWGVAGAAAVLFGGLAAGLFFAPATEDEVGFRAAVAEEPGFGSTGHKSVPRTSPVGVGEIPQRGETNEVVASKSQAVAVSLRDIPAEDEELEPSEGVADGSPTAPGPVELDDLPFE